MKKLIIIAVMLALAASKNLDKNEEVGPEPVPTTISPPTSTTTNTPPTNATTTKPTTTSTKPTTPTTTTLAPTTTPSVPTTTPTAATTTAAPTVPTTMKPKPKDPEILTFNVTDPITNVTCIVLKMALMFEVPYETNKNGTHHAKVMVEKGAVASGNCGPEVQNISLKWSPVGDVEDTVTLIFKKNDTKKDYELMSVMVKLMVDDINFPDAKLMNNTINIEHDKKEFVTPLSMSYKCKKEEPLNLTSATNLKETVAKLIVSSLQMEAFRNNTNHVFSEAEDCDPFETPGIVPIAVGCSLAALIVIVLVAYLVGRRRSQARGYLSM